MPGTLTRQHQWRRHSISSATHGHGHEPGLLTVSDNTRGGVNVVRVTPNGAAATLTFANTGTFSLRGGTRGAWQFVATNGALGDANGAQIKFVGTPFTGAGGLLANSSGGGTVGFATVSDSFGANFATYTASNGIVSIANPASGVSITTLNDTVSGITTTGNNQLNISPGTTVTASGAVTAVSLRISPGAGSTLAMGANNLIATALMVDGRIASRSLALGTSGLRRARYVYVNNLIATLRPQVVHQRQSNDLRGSGFTL